MEESGSGSIANVRRPAPLAARAPCGESDRGVFEDDAAPRRDAEPLGAEQEYLGIGLAARNVFPRNQYIDQAPQPPALQPVAGAARGIGRHHAHGVAQSPGLLQERAGPQSGLNL